MVNRPQAPQISKAGVHRMLLDSKRLSVGSPETILIPFLAVRHGVDMIWRADRNYRYENIQKSPKASQTMAAAMPRRVGPRTLAHARQSPPAEIGIPRRQIAMNAAVAAREGSEPDDETTWACRYAPRHQLSPLCQMAAREADEVLGMLPSAYSKSRRDSGISYSFEPAKWHMESKSTWHSLDAPRHIDFSSAKMRGR